ncbi:MAG: 4-hydroxy-tetrahydrodipicolinate synthase family protein [Armatimonadota bacterium]
MKFEGAWTALVTPMMPDGAVDWDGFEKSLNFQIEQGITGLVPTGTTGESPTLTWEEHNHLVERTLDVSAGKCDCLPGTGSNSTQEAVESTRHAVEHGAKAALLVDCYYNGPSSLELREEYYAVLAGTFPETALVPYVIPGRSGTALGAEDLAILAAKYPNVRTVKEATGDLERMALERRLLGPDFAIMSGDDDITFKIMSSPEIRAAGVISVISNVAPAAVEKMTRAILAGNQAEGATLAKALSPFFGIVTVKAISERVLPDGSGVRVEDKFRNPLALKTLMEGLGMPAGPARRPLGKMTEEGVATARNAARTVWEKNPEILSPIGEFYGVKIAARLADDSIWSALAY